MLVFGLVLAGLTLPWGQFSVAAPVSIPIKISNQNRITFSLPYTMGTHVGKVTRLETGSVFWDKDSRSLDGLELSFRVADIEMDGAKLKCHMRESLELDYESSGFPESHVCVDDRLPNEGPDSSRYPGVRFKSRTAEVLSLSRSAEKPRNLKGELNLHGVSREVTLLITDLKEEPGRIHIKGRLLVPLRNFGITVKPFLFVTVADEASVEWDLALELP
jgi:polyisoprenoid-binding protein YceI